MFLLIRKRPLVCKLRRIGLLGTIGFLFSIATAFGQRDIIVTQADEQIRCRILEESAVRFTYAYLQNGKAMRSEIFKNLVKSFAYNHFPEDLPQAKLLPKALPPPPKPASISGTSEPKDSANKPEGKLTKTPEKKPKAVPKADPTPLPAQVATSSSPDSAAASPMFRLVSPQKYRIGLRTGLGNRLHQKSNTISAYDYYNEKLLRGWVWGADAAVFLRPSIGLGVTYTEFRAGNSAASITYFNQLTQSEATGSIANKHTIQFVGPQLLLRKSLDYRTNVVATMSPGIFLYRDKGAYNDLSYQFRGKGYGAAATLGIDFLLGNEINGRDVMLSLEAGYQHGTIKELNYGGTKGIETLANPLVLNRLDFTVGLRFSRFPKYFRLTSY